MPPKLNRKYCCVKSCRNNSTTSGVTLFRFPKDSERCLIWLKNCGRMDLAKLSPEHLYTNYRLCNTHFQNKMFAGPVADLSKNKLKKYATPEVVVLEECNVPTTEISEDVLEDSEEHKTPEKLEFSEIASQINWDDNPGTLRSTDIKQENIPRDIVEPLYGEPTPGTSKSPDVEHTMYRTEDVAIQTPQSLSWDSPRKQELRLKIKRLSSERRIHDVEQTPSKRQTLSKEHVLAYFKEHFNEGFTNLIETSLNLRERNPKGYRYTQEYKQFALTVYFLGPNVYEYLAKIVSGAVNRDVVKLPDRPLAGGEGFQGCRQVGASPRRGYPKLYTASQFTWLSMYIHCTLIWHLAKVRVRPSSGYIDPIARPNWHLAEVQGKVQT
ncbi:hypothetical protein NQ317_017306 [Molorchus minor]|uniref:THAP-type domain-containing protein n=1 Tax=Molorchus minor TaxID=1323400 RepID=A0ABQ9ITF8_9CUCU|nr:hypothetical protein NQ317_017306 [Molorchus minor]